MKTSEESLPPDTSESMRRILNAVEPTKRKPAFEMAYAIVLALATTTSAWCAYQSLAVLLFLGTVASLTTMPICHE